MKAMTCQELGGPCDKILSGDSWDEIAEKMAVHISKEHSGIARAMGGMRHEDPNRWRQEMRSLSEAEPQA